MIYNMINKWASVLHKKPKEDKSYMVVVRPSDLKYLDTNEKEYLRYIVETVNVGRAREQLKPILITELVDVKLANEKDFYNELKSLG